MSKFPLRGLGVSWMAPALDADVCLGKYFRREQEPALRTDRPLDTGWWLEAMPGQDQVPAGLRAVRVPATVPGCVHTDLLAAGLLDDPYLDDNEDAVAWVGRTDWRYTTSLHWEPDGTERVDLVFDGLDTVAQVFLNGVEVGRTANMHRSYRFDATPVIKAGDNELTVTFTSAWTYGEQERDRLGPLPNAFPTPFNFVRKMACSFGWDWGLSTVTSGLWRPVRLEGWSTARLAQVRPEVTVADDVGRVRVVVDIAGARTAEPPATGLVVVVSVRGVGVDETMRVDVPAGEGAAVVSLDVPHVRRWWPHGHGDQALYELDVRLHAAGGATPHDAWTRRIGFRDLRLDTSEDDEGRAFTMVVNDRPLFVRGVNWIPDDAFPSRVGARRYRERLTQARDAGVDLVRVWGGGIYESDDFYNACDELGLMVWQDFLFACAAYPEEAPIAAEVEAEARENVARLMPHPSLVLWNGNNENIWGWFDWGWQEAIGERTWGLGFYLDLLPRVVAETDPARPYWPGSPYSGGDDVHPNDPRHGPMHIWDVWNQRDYTAYRDYVPRFVAEFGYQAPPTWSTLTRAVHDDPLAPDSPGVLHHQKAEDGNGKLARGLAAHFAEPDTVEDWHFLTQLNQARALSLGVEHFRSHRPTCMGTVWWQLNDCWPVTSWAVVDGDGSRKPSWYALRRSYRTRLLTVQPRDGGLAAVLVNDGDEPWRTSLRMARHSTEGVRLAERSVTVECAGYATVEVPLGEDVATPEHPDAELVVVDDEDGQRATWWFVADRDAVVPLAEYDADVIPTDDGFDVAVTARTLLRDLCLFVDRFDPDATVGDMLATVMPGETARVHVESQRHLDEAALTAPPVLRCSNDRDARGERVAAVMG